MSKYIIVQNVSLGDLVSEINERMNKGYKPHGELQLVEQNGSEWWQQVMIYG